MLGRHGEYLAACAEHRALPARGDIKALYLRRDVLERRQGVRPVAAHLDGDATGLADGGVVQPDVAAVLEYDALPVGARPEHVEIVEIGDLADVAAVRVHDEQVEGEITIRDPVDAVVGPHRLLVGADKVRQLPRGVVLEVIGPDVLRPAAAVTFPGAKFAIKRREYVGLAVG